MSTTIRARDCCIAVLAGLLSAACALAQSPSRAAVPEVLKELRPSGATCLREEAASNKPGATVVPVHVIPDLSCAIAPKDLAALLPQMQATTIDVRSPAEYDAFRIDAALNTTVSALRSKAFLRDKTIVLVGSGLAERELYAACAALKTQGFKRVKVLRGGMPAWLLGGQPTVGRTVDASQLTRLGPAELWVESQFDANLVVVVRSQAEIHRRVAFSTLVADESLASVQAVMERRRKELRNAALAAVVLVTLPTVAPDVLQRLRDALRPTPLLVFADSPQAYARYLGQQNAVWVAQARGPKKLPCGL